MTSRSGEGSLRDDRTLRESPAKTIIFTALSDSEEIVDYVKTHLVTQEAIGTIARDISFLALSNREHEFQLVFILVADVDEVEMVELILLNWSLHD